MRGRPPKFARACPMGWSGRNSLSGIGCISMEVFLAGITSHPHVVYIRIEARMAPMSSGPTQEGRSKLLSTCGISSDKCICDRHKCASCADVSPLPNGMRFIDGNKFEE